MDFIFNSRQKKVEVFYDNEVEQKALFEFLGKHMKFKTGGIPTDDVYLNAPEISWATINTQPAYTISATNNLSGAVTLNNNAMSTTADLPVTDTSIIQPLNTYDIPIATCSCCYDSASADTARKALGLNINQLEKNIKTSIETSTNSKERKAYAAVKLDNSSDEGGYSYLTASVPRKTK